MNMLNHRYIQSEKYRNVSHTNEHILMFQPKFVQNH